MRFLENDIIKLRALEPEDLDILYRWENDSTLWQHGSTLAPYSRYSLKEYIEDSRLDIFHSRQLRLMIVLKDTEECAGTIDLYDFDPSNARAGVGILIDSAFRQQGLAKQTLMLIREYAFHFLSLRQLYAYVGVSNEISFHLFAKCGYEKAGLLRSWVRYGDSWEDVHLMQLLNVTTNSSPVYSSHP